MKPALSILLLFCFGVDLCWLVAFAFTQNSLLPSSTRPPILRNLNIIFRLNSPSSSSTTTASGDSETQQEQQTMEETYNQLAQEIIQARQAKGTRLWLAVAGAPGSGKTTVSQHIVDRIHDASQQQSTSSFQAAVVPMDGYHLTQAAMAQSGYDMKRRGAPWTFNASQMYKDLAAAHSDNDVWLPDYSREISDPVPNQIQLQANDPDIVIIEGLYVLLGALCQELDDPDSPTNQVATELKGEVVDIREEIKRWEPLMKLWDETYFVEPPGGFSENKLRLVERSLKTWTAAKTKLWLPEGGTDREAATRRVELNDEFNAKLINCCKRYASRVIQNK